MTEDELEWERIKQRNVEMILNKQRYRSITTMEEQQGKDIMGEGRRSDDHRFKRIEEDIREIKSNNKEMSDDIIYIKTRIDNGFSTSIQSTEDKVTYIDAANKEDHGNLRSDIKGLSKKLDKILWTFVGITFIAVAARAIEYIVQIS